MSLVATARLSSPLLPLVDVSRREATELQIEGVQTTNPDRPVVVCWVETSSFEQFESSLDTDGVDGFTVLEAEPTRRLYHIRLLEPLLFPLKEAFDSFGAAPYGGTVIRNGEWIARARFPDRTALVAFRHACAAHDVAFQLESLVEAHPEPREPSRLTPKQREALLLAYESGYYDVPRRVSLGDLGERLGISKPSVSSRLRRAEHHVIRTLIEADGI